MTDDFTLATFYRLWSEYLGQIRAVIAPLTSEQLTFRASSGQRSIGEMVAHIIESRAFWLGDFIGETGAELDALHVWYDPGDRVADAAELVLGLDQSWQFVEQRLKRWTPDEMRQTFPHDWRGEHYELSRAWVVWHVLEHDLRHGGELSLTLGMHGLQAPDI